MKPHYYNEFHKPAAQWLRNLIAAGLLPQGDVDERSITEVQPDDLRGYGSCHFFAGIGGWAYAARLAGWPDNREIWTGSPPCQPFSVAGKQRGTDDERHLWPYLFRLIGARRPPVFMGEQVAAAVGKGWLDGVLDDLEGIGYTGRAVVVPACAVNAPHRRDRAWFVASAPPEGTMGYSERTRLEGFSRNDRATRGWTQQGGSVAATGGGVALVHNDSHGRQQGSEATASAGYGRAVDAAGWGDAEWLICYDGKARRVPNAESGIPLLVNGLPTRMDGTRADRNEAIKGFGNAIVPQVAAEVIGAFMDCDE